MLTYFFLAAGQSEFGSTLEIAFLFPGKPLPYKAPSVNSSGAEAPLVFKVDFAIWHWLQPCIVSGCPETSYFLRIVIFQLTM